MAIHSFYFEDLDSGWKLEEVRFQDVNLLVGPSGVGKTRILRALLWARDAGLTGQLEMNRSRWGLTLTSERDTYTWLAEISGSRKNSWEEYSRIRFVRETLTRNEGEILVERTPDRFLFGGRELPRLQETESAIKLLQSEDSIHPMHNSLAQMIALRLPFATSFVTHRSIAHKALADNLKIELLKQSPELPTFLKAYVLQENFPDSFGSILQLYRDIFPTVSDLRIATYDELGLGDTFESEPRGQYLTLGVRETGVKDWIPLEDISDGMLKALAYLTELTLSSPGRIFLVDELENSLGVNCLPDVTGHLMGQPGDVQLIMTSHHPQVINNITSDSWKLVTRKGSTVSVRDASDFPALRTVSPLEKFIQLINLPEYEEGIA